MSVEIIWTIEYVASAFCFLTDTNYICFPFFLLQNKLFKETWSNNSGRWTRFDIETTGCGLVKSSHSTQPPPTISIAFFIVSRTKIKNPHFNYCGGFVQSRVESWKKSDYKKRIAKGNWKCFLFSFTREGLLPLCLFFPHHNSVPPPPLGHL